MSFHLALVRALQHSVLLATLLVLPLAASAGVADDHVRELNGQVLELQARAAAGDAATLPNGTAPGDALATRARALRALIESDPSAAAALAFPPEVLDSLTRSFPAQRALFEKRGGWQGELEVLIEDGADLRAHRTLFRLHRVSEVVEMNFAGRLPNSLRSGMRVSARGVRLDDAMAVTELEWLDAPFEDEIDGENATPDAYPATCGPTGAQNVLTVLVNLPGYTLPPAVTADFVEGAVLGNAYSEVDSTPDWSVDDFWRQNSDGKAFVDPANSLVYGPVKLASNFNTDAGGANYCDNYGLRDALFKAIDPSVDFKRYSRIQIVMPNNGACSWAGTANVGCRSLSSTGDGSFNASVAWLRADTMQTRARAVQLMTHEKGHNLGLYHASSRDFGAEALGSVGGAGTINEYGDIHSTMGSWNLGFYAASHMANQLGWLGAANYRVVQSSGTHTIQNYEARPAGLKALKVRRGTGNEAWLWIESRQNTGLYSSQLNAQIFTGALIHYEDSRTGGATHLLDFTPASASFGDAALVVGETWDDPYSDVAVRVDSVTANALTVTVSYGSPVCSTAAPTVSVTPTTASAGAGGALSGTLTVRNNSSTACASETFNLATSAPAGWSAGTSVAALTIAPGQQAQAGLSVTVAGTQAPGTFTVTPSASSATTAKAGSAALEVTVTGSSCSYAAPSITVAPDALIATAGSSATATVTVRNNSSTECAAETVRLSSNLPGGWTKTFGKTSHTLEPGQQVQTTFTAGAPATQVAGTYGYALTARSVASSLSSSDALSFTVQASACTRVAPVVTMTPSSIAVLAGTSVTTTVSVTNDSDARCTRESFGLAVVLPAGWSSSFAQPTLDVGPGETLNTTLTVNVPASAAEGDVSLLTSATGTDSGTSGSTLGDFSVESPVCTRAAPGVTLSPAAASTTAGGSVSTTVTLTNHSSLACGAENFEVRVAKPSGWIRTITPATFSLQPGQSSESTAVLTTPSTQPSGTTLISVRGRSIVTGLSTLQKFGVTTE